MPALVRVRVLVLAMLMALVCTEAGAERARITAGRSIAEVLQQFRREGLRLIFSSDLVTPDLRVRATPHATDPRAIVVEILAPFGLTLRAGPRGTWLVVRGLAVRGSRAAGLRTRSSDAPPSVPHAPAMPAPAGTVPLTHHVEERVDVLGAVAVPPAVTAVAMTPAHVTEAAGGFENPLQVLQTLPGAAAVNDQEGRLSVRGAESEYNVILLDGVPIRNPFRSAYLPTSLFSPSVLSSVTLDASGLDAGLGGLSSVVAIETRDGASADAWSGSGSLNLLTGDLLLEGGGPDADARAWWLNVRGTYYDVGFDRLAGQAQHPGFADVQFKLALRPTPQTRLTVLGLGGLGSMRDRTHEPGSRRFDGNTQIGVATLRWTTPDARVTTTTSLSAYHDASNHERAPNHEEAAATADDGFRRRIGVWDLGLRHSVTARVRDAHRLDAGIDVHHLHTSWLLTGRQSPEWLDSVAPSVWGERKTPPLRGVGSVVSKSEVSAWLQDSIRVTPSLEVRPGLRVEWNGLTHQAEYLPRLRITHRRGAWRTWGGVGWQAQTPGHETMQQGIALYVLEEAGDSLRNQRARQVVAGVERRLGAGFVARAEAFHRAFDRLLVHRLETDEQRRTRLSAYDLPPDLPADSALLEHRPTLTPESLGTGRAYGVESLLRRDVGRVAGWLSYTWSRADRTLDGRTIPFDFDRRHALSMVAAVGLTPRLRLAGTWQIASGFPFTPDVPDVQFGEPDEDDRDGDGNRSERLPVRDREGRLVTAAGPEVGRPLAVRNTSRLTPYSRVDLRLSFLKSQRWEYYAEVVNLLGRRNHVHRPPGDLPARDVYGGYGLMPSFGLRFTF